MPLGLPPHLATRTTTTAVARAGHAAAAVSLIGVGVIVISIQAYLPEFVVWPALLVLVPMIVLLGLLERAPSTFIAASYLVIGAGPRLGASMVWTTAGFAIGELASFVALLVLGSPWRLSVTTVVVWFIVVGLLAVLRIDLLTSRDSQIELYRAARDEMLADVRRTFEARATALLHDTVLNQLAVITTTQRELSPAARAGISADLALIVGQEWFDVGDQAERDAGERAQRLRAAIDEAAAGVVTVELSPDAGVLDALDGEAFDEFSRAIAQCIANVRRHADTGTAEVVLGGSDTEVSAMVIDDGRGFALDERTDGRLGVGTSIVGRLETIGGSAVVWSQPGKGTSVLLRVPVRVPGDDEGAS